MRIIAGQAKGRTLKVPREVSRPTTDRVRESLFGILEGVIKEAQVLDLFAGSGALGLEALSRGAAYSLFIEHHRGAAKIISDNAAKIAPTQTKVICRDVFSFLKGHRGAFDLIFADPPYADGLHNLLEDLLQLDDWASRLTKQGLLIVEQATASAVIPVPELEVLEQRDYGRSRIVIYQRTS